MYAIMGITGQIGGVIARALLAANQPVRAVVRDAIKGQAWLERGCEVALATIENAASLAAALRRATGVFLLVPPNFDPLPGSLSASHRRDVTSRVDASQSGTCGLPFDDWGTGKRAEPAHPAHDHRESHRRIANAGNVPTSGLVHGKLQLGCSSSEQGKV